MGSFILRRAAQLGAARGRQAMRRIRNRERREFQPVVAQRRRQRALAGKLQLAQLCIGAGKDAIAQPLLDEIAAAVETYKLEEWEDREMVAGVPESAVLAGVLTRPGRGRGCYPARAGGLWLRMTLVRSGFHAVVVPSGFSTRVQPSRWITT